MKILVTESQYKRILREEEEEQKILRVPGLNFFHENHWEAWQILQKVLKHRGYPPYTIDGYLFLAGRPIKSLGNLQSVGESLDLRGTPIKSLKNLQSVGGNLDLRVTSIESLGNLQSVGGVLDLQFTSIESLGNLQTVGGDLDLRGTPIESLGNLTSVGKSLYLEETPLSKMYTEKQIREMVDVGDVIFM